MPLTTKNKIKEAFCILALKITKKDIDPQGYCNIGLENQYPQLVDFTKYENM